MSISFGFAAVERQTAKLKTLKMFFKCWVVALAPMANIKISPQQVTPGISLVNKSTNENFLRVTVFAVQCPPRAT